MSVPNAVSSEVHDASAKRDVAVVQGYLKTQFPEHIIEVLKENDNDLARNVRTFSIRNNGQRYVLRVAEEVLDLTDGAIVYLRRFQVAQMLRGAGAGKAILVTTTEALVEPLVTDEPAHPAAVGGGHSGSSRAEHLRRKDTEG